MAGKKRSSLAGCAGQAGFDLEAAANASDRKKRNSERNRQVASELLETWSQVRHIGVDEAGRGCLAGPVAAAAVLFPENFDFKRELAGLADSKKLDEKKRARLRIKIEETAVAFGVGLSWQDEIDAINILNATFRAMSRAVLLLANQLEKTGETACLPCLLIDGNKVIPEKHWQACIGRDDPDSGHGRIEFDLPFITRHDVNQPLPSTDADGATDAGAAKKASGSSAEQSVLDAALSEIYRSRHPVRLPKRIPALSRQVAIIDGDDLVPSISAASILAKTARDELMAELDAVCPGYDFTRHKGYGTQIHRERLILLGLSPLHRRSFSIRLESDPPPSDSPVPKKG